MLLLRLLVSKRTPYGRWGGRCVWAKSQLLAHHIQGDKVWTSRHTDTRSCPGTKQRHAALWSRRGAQTTLLRWGWQHTIFQKRGGKGNTALCVITGVIKPTHESTMRDSPWGMVNSVTALISPLAPHSRHHIHFYGLYAVYPAALLFKRRQTGIVTERMWQKCSPVQQLFRELIISDSNNSGAINK